MEEISSSRKSASFPLEQRNQSYNDQVRLTMPYFTEEPQLVEKPLRMVEGGEFEQPHLGFLHNMHLEPQQEGYSDANSTPLCLRSMGMEDIRNSSLVINSGATNYDSLGLGSVASSLKRKMNYQDDATPNSRGWKSFVRGDPDVGSSNLAGFGHGYTLYDERYQTIGLPVDPHLRIFNATNGNGK